VSEPLDELGPIDWVLIEFDNPLTGAAVPPLLDLVHRGLIRVMDALMVRKMADGSFAAIELTEPGHDETAELSELGAASSGLLSDADVAAAAEALENDTRGVLLLYENLWAVPFVSALRGQGGQLVASGRIPVQEIIDALDAADAADAAS
jgi:hypothetical protein